MATIPSPGFPSDAPSPIQRLPPEILGKIFGFAVKACKRSCTLFRSSYATWYNFTFVSRYWRSVALSTPHIWGALLFFNQTRLSVMLERSKMADLSVDSDLCYPRLSAVVSLVKGIINEHTSRITELSLKVGDSVLSFLLEELKKRPPSLRLRELHLRSAFGLSQVFPSAVLVPDRLQVLEAYGFNFTWEPSQSFPCLTDLTIGMADFKVPLSGFITALRGMPALEYLHLQDSLSYERSDPSVEPALLVRLRKLIIRTQCPSQISDFLDLITIPVTADIQIYYIRTKLSGLSVFTSSIHSLIRRMHSEDEGFGGCHYESVWIRAEVNVVNIIASRTIDNDDNNFDLNVDSLFGCTPEETLQKIFPAILPNKIQSLRLDFGVRTKTLLNFSDSLPLLRNVILGCEAVPNFIAVMMLETHTTLPFENIRYLALNNAKFSSRIYGGLEVRELRHFVERRSKSHAKLEKLTIFRCSGILKHNILRLRETVDVEWDGFEYRLG